jgi:hypothetical protein
MEGALAPALRRRPAVHRFVDVDRPLVNARTTRVVDLAARVAGSG